MLKLFKYAKVVYLNILEKIKKEKCKYAKVVYLNILKKIKKEKM